MRRVLCFLLILGLCVGPVSWVTAVATQQTPSSWINPTEKALKRVSTIPGAQHEPVAFNNLNCELLTYRLVNSSEMRSGCFTPTAFGMMESSNDVVIFNGTDEGIPLIPKGNGVILVPWPNASTLIVLNPLTTGGSYISLYSSPLAAMRDERNALLQLTAKRLVELPDIQLRDSAGQRLIINSGTMAISDGGSWLVAETLTGSFVRINLATLDTKLFAPAYATGGLPSRIAVSDDGRYVAIQNKSYEHFKVHDLANCVGNTCSSHNYHSFVNSQVGIKSTNHLRFVNNSQLSIEITATDSTRSGVYHLAPKASITSFTDYIGMGDSYTSGEGAYNYRDGTDTEANLCHQSVHAYPALLTKNLFSDLGGHSVACSGARIGDVGSNSDSYRGQMRNGISLAELKTSKPELLESVETNYLPGYVAQQRFVKRWQPKIVTVSIGGNDVGFGDILYQCVMPKVSRHHSDSTCFNSFEDRVEVKTLVDRTVVRWTALFKHIKTLSPATEVYVVGYPDIIDDTGRCAINVQLGKGELVFAKELLVYINERIEKAARAADVTYVDISQALVGHRLCETKSHNVAVNGLTAGRDTFVFGRESYHPNALGHQMIARAIMEQTKNLTSGTGSEAQEKETDLLRAPSSGRSIYNRQPASFTDTVITRGREVTIRLNDGLLKPGTSYEVRTNGPLGAIIATGTVGADGSTNSVFTLPSETPPGPNIIDITGKDQTDEPTYITQPIYVPETSGDMDGDGVPDVSDACPGIINSGQDIDGDGIDDVCDPLIEEPAPQEPQNDDAPTPTLDSSIPPRSQVSLTRDTHVATSSLQINITAPKVLTNSTDVYHVQGVRVNNLNGSDALRQVSNPNLQESRRIRHKDPWIVWWVYAILLPVVGLVVCKSVQLMRRG